MSIRKVTAILKKQMKETLKNKTVLIQFIMFPILSLIMQSSIQIPNMPKNYFVILFATMYVGMSPLTSMASVISEEKEKNTLRELLLSNVRAVEYLAGIGIYIFFMCMMGALVFGIAGNFHGKELLYFMSIMAAGILIALLIGAVIGVWSRNQITSTSVTVPVMLVFSFFPMISMYNQKAADISRFLYSQQVNNLMYAKTIHPENVIILILNALLAIFLFAIAYRRSRLTMA